MTNDVEITDWRELCAAAAKERDPEKLMALVEKINAALDDREIKGTDSSVDPEDDSAPGKKRAM